MGLQMLVHHGFSPRVAPWCLLTSLALLFLLISVQCSLWPPPKQAALQPPAILTLPGVPSVVCQAKHNQLGLETIVNTLFYLTDMWLECAVVHYQCLLKV